MNGHFPLSTKVSTGPEGSRHKQCRLFLANLASSLSTLQNPIPFIFSLISLLMDPLLGDIAPYPEHDQVFKHTTTPGAPSCSNVGDITDRDAGAGVSDLLGLEDTTAEPLAS
jgi:hypothetical protein